MQKINHQKNEVGAGIASHASNVLRMLRCCEFQASLGCSVKLCLDTCPTNHHLITTKTVRQAAFHNLRGMETVLRHIRT